LIGELFTEDQSVLESKNADERELLLIERGRKKIER